MSSLHNDAGNAGPKSRTKLEAMTKKNTNINQYAIHYKTERKAGKKPKHAGKIKPVISKQKHGKMLDNEDQFEPEARDGSKDVLILIGYTAAVIVAIYALAKALDLI